VTRDINVLREWIRVVSFITAICTTAVPIIYSFSPWRSRVLGKLFMLQAISFAVAIDVSATFSIWRPSDILVIFWVDAIILTAVAASTASLTIFIWRMNAPNRKPMTMLLSGPLYDNLKKVVQVGLPGLGTLYFTLSQIWGLPDTEQVVGTIGAVALFLGLLLGLSSKTYNQDDNKYDGMLQVEPHNEEGDMLRLTSVDMKALESKPEILLKINRPNAA
jgi:hypothetical protein